MATTVTPPPSESPSRRASSMAVVMRAAAAGSGYDFLVKFFVRATGNLAALIKITVDGGAGTDKLYGSGGKDSLLGSDGTVSQANCEAIARARRAVWRWSALQLPSPRGGLPWKAPCLNCCW